MNSIARFGWTGEKIDFMVGLMRTGFSAEYIAHDLMREYGGTLTRNAVLGKLHRMGHSRPHEAMAPGRPTRQEVRDKRKRSSIAGERLSSGAAGAITVKVNRTTTANRKLRAKVLSGEEEIAIEGDGLRDLPPDQSPDAVSLLEVKDKQCRWPLNDPGPGFLFCGSEVVACSYCARHFRLAHNTTKHHFGSPRPHLMKVGSPYNASYLTTKERAAGFDPDAVEQAVGRL